MSGFFCRAFTKFACKLPLCQKSDGKRLFFRRTFNFRIGVYFRQTFTNRAKVRRNTNGVCGKRVVAVAVRGDTVVRTDGDTLPV